MGKNERTIMKNTIESIVTGAIFDFAGFITTRPNSLSFGSSENASPMVKLIEEWAASRSLDLNEPLVQSWQDVIKNGVDTPKIQGLTCDRIIIDELYEVNHDTKQ